MSMLRSGEYVENVQNAENVQDWAEVKGPRSAWLQPVVMTTPISFSEYFSVDIFSSSFSWAIATYLDFYALIFTSFWDVLFRFFEASVWE